MIRARQAEFAQATAAVQIAEAALEQAKITLGYTRITAPIAGRIGRTAITGGNIVSPVSGPLTTIVNDDVVWAVFAPSQREVLEYNKAAFANPPLTTTESDVAEAVFLAATDGADRLRYPAGPDAVALAAA